VKHAAWSIAAAGLLAGSGALAEPFSYDPPGVLVPGSGDGRVDEYVYVPGMRFPIETGPAYANSQVWGHGGSEGPGGGQCDIENWSYPWHDNYCETRSWDMPLCPAGTGHQGQDIRAGTCEKDVHWVVATADGTVSHIGSYSLYVMAADGTRFDFLHMSNLQVGVGDEVKRGQRLGKVSNEFGGTPTTIHLHFNIQQNVSGLGTVFVPPYMSLVTSYQNLVNAPPEGVLESLTCERARGASRDLNTPDEPNDVNVSIDGTYDDLKAIRFDVTADRPTDALCEDGAAPCAHGFDTLLPVRILDGQAHEVHVVARDSSDEGAPVELGGSPQTLECAAFSTKDRVRREIEGEDSLSQWGFSLFFDQLPVAEEDVASLGEGPAWPADPVLVASEDGAEHWVHDGPVLRPISDDAMFAFRFELEDAEVWSGEQRNALKPGRPWPARPVLVAGKGADTFYVLDGATDVPLLPGDGSGGGGGGGGDPGESGPEGCACRTTQAPSGPGGGALAVAILGLVAARMRRRREPADAAGARVG